MDWRHSRTCHLLHPRLIPQSYQATAGYHFYTVISSCAVLSSASCSRGVRKEMLKGVIRFQCLGFLFFHPPPPPFLWVWHERNTNVHLESQMNGLDLERPSFLWPWLFFHSWKHDGAEKVKTDSICLRFVVMVICLSRSAWEVDRCIKHSVLSSSFTFYILTFHWFMDIISASVMWEGSSSTMETWHLFLHSKI